MDIRPYDPRRDIRAVERIWYECGWIENPEQAGYVRDFIGTGNCIVGCLDGVAECSVHTAPGTLDYLDEKLNLCAVTAVATSLIARKQGLATVMTAQQLASAAETGAEVAMLGIFDQGFYDQLGFGTGSYDHFVRFDPATLLVDRTFRVPRRLHTDDWSAVHGSLARRLSHHGGCVLTPPELMKAELAWHDNGIGLGYFEGDVLTHFLWGEASQEHGPLKITFMAYRSIEELLELLALVRSLGDQFSVVEMQEPGHLQLQALLRQPFRNRRNTRRGEFENVHNSTAWWQIRMLDLDACLRRHHWPGQPFAFNLVLDDPVADYLEGDGWRGLAGEYTISVADTSGAKPGMSPGLPVLSTTVNTFSRLFFGIGGASMLQASDGLKVPEALLADLDRAFCLPRMVPSWNF